MGFLLPSCCVYLVLAVIVFFRIVYYFANFALIDDTIVSPLSSLTSFVPQILKKSNHSELQKWPKIAKMAQKWPKMAQKLAPAEKNSTNWLARLARFCNSAKFHIFLNDGFPKSQKMILWEECCDMLFTCVMTQCWMWTCMNLNELVWTSFLHPPPPRCRPTSPTKPTPRLCMLHAYSV